MEIHHGKTRNRQIIIDKLKAMEFVEIDGEMKTEQNKQYVHLFRNNKQNKV